MQREKFALWPSRRDRRLARESRRRTGRGSRGSRRNSGPSGEARHVRESSVMLLKAVAFDWGHTVVDENRDGDIPLDVRPVYLMPGVSEVLPRIAFPLALWANTRLAREPDVRAWLRRAGLDECF